MPESDKPTTTTTYQEGKPIRGYRGSRAKESFLSTEEVSEDKDWQQYKIERKLSFAAQKKQHEADFNEWRKKKAGQSGRASALKEEPKE